MHPLPLTHITAQARYTPLTSLARGRIAEGAGREGSLTHGIREFYSGHAWSRSPSKETYNRRPSTR
jgi:hypothetical protein